MTETPAPCGTVPQSDFASQFRRIFEAAECRTQVELAAALEIKQPSISDAKRRKSVPSYWLVKLFRQKQVNPEWILCGTGAKYLVSADIGQNAPHVLRIPEIRPPRECSAQDLISELVRRALRNMDLTARQESARLSPPIPAGGPRRFRARRKSALHRRRLPARPLLFFRGL